MSVKYFKLRSLSIVEVLFASPTTKKLRVMAAGSSSVTSVAIAANLLRNLNRFRNLRVEPITWRPGTSAARHKLRVYKNEIGLAPSKFTRPRSSVSSLKTAGICIRTLLHPLSENDVAKNEITPGNALNILKSLNKCKPGLAFTIRTTPLPNKRDLYKLICTPTFRALVANLYKACQKGHRTLFILMIVTIRVSDARTNVLDDRHKTIMYNMKEFAGVRPSGSGMH
ncbi:hypothetical protein N0V90_011390 [Kalmusia sp. IMI 367209]|nr:hypothetical protein N0V90_011390 [Kalmusia sp. IMI 367209]